MRYLYPGLVMVWLASGFAMHAYLVWTTPGPADVRAGSVQTQAQIPRQDARALEDHAFAIHAAAAYVGWALAGFALALRGVHLLFRRADHVSDVETFLAASAALMLWAGPIQQAIALESRAGAGTAPMTIATTVAADTPIGSGGQRSR